MKPFSARPIRGLGIPLAVGLLTTAQGLFLNTTMVTSYGSAPQVTASATTTWATPSVESAPQVTAPATQAVPDNSNYTVTLINSHTAPVVTIHGQGAGSPTAVGKDNEPHTMSQSETATFALPTGWSGRVAMYEDGYIGDLDRATLLEGSFVKGASQQAVIALDVSYVDGFTVPLVCDCNNTVVIGCNLDLHPMCPDDSKRNAKQCANPNREFKVGVPPTNPFKDCQGLAYTYPQDDLATKYDIAGCSWPVIPQKRQGQEFGRSRPQSLRLWARAVEPCLGNAEDESDQRYEITYPKKGKVGWFGNVAIYICRERRDPSKSSLRVFEVNWGLGSLHISRPLGCKARLGKQASA
ncbi:hypothetical protein F5Y13DRAFT_191973 [Hypoxylon sp. FL1857]|nr:hypothetical protein F5Y13DRAFT_191973 [Hypoxylon sp. FL1857]